MIAYLPTAYFMQYLIMVAFALIMSTKIAKLYPEHKDEYLYQNGYLILYFAYRVGNFISRSSLPYIKIRRVNVLTAI